MPNKVEWDKVTIRASSMGALATEPRDKEAKQAGELAATSHELLVKEYVYHKYERYYDSPKTTAMKKGTSTEEESIDKISLFDNVLYTKNTERAYNEWCQGEMDMYLGESVYNAKVVRDAKSSENILTLLKNLIPGEVKKRKKMYYWQLQTYMFLSGAERASIDYVLNNMPEELLLEKEAYILKSMPDAVTILNVDYQKAVRELRKLNTFDDIPFEEKILRFEVNRNQEDIDKIPGMVQKARTWLAEFEDKHLNHNRILVYVP